MKNYKKLPQQQILLRIKAKLLTPCAIILLVDNLQYH